VRGIAGLDLIPKFDTRTKDYEIRFCFAYRTTLHFCLRVDPGTGTRTGSTACARTGSTSNARTNHKAGTIATGTGLD